MSDFSTAPAKHSFINPDVLLKASLPIFAAVMFLSATLLFWVEPLFAKMVLPLLGGSPAVWNTAMLFFQTMLLGGYAYAHLLSRYTQPRTQVMVQFTVLLIGVLFLPFAIGANVIPPEQGTPVFWLFGLFAVVVGVPFFALSANAPLMQSWFARTGHAQSDDPYFLYGASNMGSILALLAFPFILEPALGVAGQTHVWKVLYILLAAGIAGSGLIMLMRENPTQAALQETDETAPALAGETPALAMKLRWLVLAFVPSSLLLGTTTYISTDIASAPLLWVIPLTLYLLTFVNVFARNPLIPHTLVVKIAPLFAVVFALLFHSHGLWALGLHLVAFFLFAMLCHGELAKRRPAASHLTEFYMIMSAGGVLGGVSNALIAPLLFNNVYEYPMAIALACMLIPAASALKLKTEAADFLVPAGLFAAFALPVWLLGMTLGLNAQSWMIYTVIVLACVSAAVAFASKDRPLRFGLTIAALLFGNLLVINQGSDATNMRSFFGVYQVATDAQKNVRTMKFGTTLHGAQYMDESKRKTPLTYYTNVGPLGQLFATLGQRPMRVAAVGLGVGTVACYAKPGDTWTYYEIDPMVDAIARNKNWFHFMSDCAGDAPVIYGDARLKLADAKPAATDLMILDAFSSDAIPTHMVTREAFELYAKNLAPGGIIAMNISNRHLDLAPVVSAVSNAAGLTGYYQIHTGEGEKTPAYFTGSIWVVMAAKSETLAAVTASGRWTKLPAFTKVDQWTDDYSDLIGALK